MSDVYRGLSWLIVGGRSIRRGAISVFKQPDVRLVYLNS
jgi:hypothetical protein